MPEVEVNLGSLNTPAWSQVSTANAPTIKVEAPKQPIYVVDKNQQSKPLGIDVVSSNKNDKPVNVKVPIKTTEPIQKQNWWSKRSKGQKIGIIAGSVVATVGIIILIRKAIK
jgi:hypothetical protein